MARVPADAGTDAAVRAAHALQITAEQLSRFLGSDGCHALFLRALRRATEAHPALQSVSLWPPPAISVGGVTESRNSYGEAAVTAGLIAWVEAVIELLGRLVGDELALKLLELPHDK